MAVVQEGRLERARPESCGYSDVGALREANQDALAADESGRLWIVADGVGGHPAGEVASRLAAETILEQMTAAGLAESENDPKRIGACLDAAVRVAHSTLLLAGADDPTRAGMSTTVIAGYFYDGGVCLCHVGDARAYVRSAGILETATRDHSVVARLVEAGRLSPDHARLHPRKNEILRAVGIDMGFEPDLTIRELVPGDIVLLCTDGLWEALPDGAIDEVLGSDTSPREQSEAMLELALAVGARDNVTFVICRV